MRKLLVIGVFLAGATCATLLILHRPGGVEASSAAPSLREPTAQAGPTARPQEHHAAAAPPIGTSSNALAQPDPDRITERSPYLRSSEIKSTPDDPEGIRSQRQMALTAYRSFVEKARLTADQKRRFDQIMDDVLKMEIADSMSALKKNQPLTIEGQETLDQEGYTRVKAMLTPEQYEVFRHEIGSSFGWMRVLLQGVPH